MSTERSPRFPSLPIEDALKYTESLFKNAGRTPVDVEVAVKAMGYNSLNGASRTTMATLSGYGLLSKVGGKYRVSDEALRIIRQVSEQDKIVTLRQVTLRPELFATIHKEHRECNEQILASTLLHQGFSEEAAKRAARIYKLNLAFAGGDDGVYADELPLQDEGMPAAGTPFKKGNEAPPQSGPPLQEIPKTPSQLSNVLATYKIPLGLNEAELTFTGDRLEVADFDALADYVAIFKKQFERACKSTPVRKLQTNSRPLYPRPAIWRNPRELDTDVTIIGEEITSVGVTMYKTDDGDSILETELEFID